MTRRRSPGRSPRATPRTSSTARSACTPRSGATSSPATCCAAAARCTCWRSSPTGCCATRSGILHILLLVCSIALAGDGLVYAIVLGAQLAWLLLALAGRLRLPVPGAALAYYYLLVIAATLAGLVRYARGGVPVVWEKAEGTR